MTMNHYQIGNGVTLTDTITIAATGVAADPTELVLLILDPHGTKTTKNIGDLTRIGDGVYSYEVIVDEPGLWYYRFVAKAPFKAAAEKSFIVFDTKIEES